eukprot:TRINITY_DN4067_c0_g1_i3.p1 TRINITY_DN4067_c0_g1~~TRINITY_DN4067_c0_g1_i3.p1  ORF type:complete len:1169 (-),score=381.65 TRINITY_DN4067_c0_g1_i3:137-3643(-)
MPQDHRPQLQRNRPNRPQHENAEDLEAFQLAGEDKDVLVLIAAKCTIPTQYSKMLMHTLVPGVNKIEDVCSWLDKSKLGLPREPGDCEFAEVEGVKAAVISGGKKEARMRALALCLSVAKAAREMPSEATMEQCDTTLGTTCFAGLVQHASRLLNRAQVPNSAPPWSKRSLSDTSDLGSSSVKRAKKSVGLGREKVKEESAPIEVFKEELGELEQSLRRTGKVRNREEKAQEAVKEKAALQDLLAETERELQGSKQKAQEAVKEKAALQDRLAETERALERAKELAKQKTQDAVKERAVLQDLLAESEQSLERAKELSKQKAKIADSSAQHEKALQQQLAEKESSLQQHQQQLAEKESSLQQHQQQLAEKESSLQQHKQESARLSREHAQGVKQLAELKDAAAKQAEALRQDAAKKAEELEQAKQQARAYSQEIEKLRDAVLQEKLKLSQAERQANHKVQAVQRDAQEQASRAERSKLEALNESKNLQQKLQDMAGSMNALRGQLQAMEKQKLDAESEALALREARAKDLASEELQQEVHQLRSLLAEAKAKELQAGKAEEARAVAAEKMRTEMIRQDTLIEQLRDKVAEGNKAVLAAVEKAAAELVQKGCSIDTVRLAKHNLQLIKTSEGRAQREKTQQKEQTQETPEERHGEADAEEQGEAGFNQREQLCEEPDLRKDGEAVMDPYTLQDDVHMKDEQEAETPQQEEERDALRKQDEPIMDPDTLQDESHMKKKHEAETPQQECEEPDALRKQDEPIMDPDTLQDGLHTEEKQGAETPQQQQEDAAVKQTDGGSDTATTPRASLSAEDEQHAMLSSVLDWLQKHGNVPDALREEDEAVIDPTRLQDDLHMKEEQEEETPQQHQQFDEPDALREDETVMDPDRLHDDPHMNEEQGAETPQQKLGKEEQDEQPIHFQGGEQGPPSRHEPKESKSDGGEDPDAVGGNAASDRVDKFKSAVEKLTKLHRVAEGGGTTEGEQSNAKKLLSREIQKWKQVAATATTAEERNMANQIVTHVGNIVEHAEKTHTCAQQHTNWQMQKWPEQEQRFLDLKRRAELCQALKPLVDEAFTSWGHDKARWDQERQEERHDKDSDPIFRWSKVLEKKDIEIAQLENTATQMFIQQQRQQQQYNMQVAWNSQQQQYLQQQTPWLQHAWQPAAAAHGYPWRR